MYSSDSYRWIQYASGDGYDVVYGYNSTDTISLGSGLSYSTLTNDNNIIVSFSNGAITLSGASGQTLNIKGGTVPSTFTTGNDYFSNSTSNTILNALAGNDTIINSATKVTINGGDGNDRISNSGASLTANGGAGDDSIYNSDRYVTLNGGSGADTVYNSDGDYSYIDLGDANDYVYGYDNDIITISAGAGNDTVNGSYYTSKLYGGAGADIISITGSSSSNTVYGNEGNDTITANGGLIYGGADADKISVSSSGDATINGGTGNDIIYGTTSNSYVNYFQYSYGDGYDIIYNYKNGDVVSIGGNSEYTTLKSGSNAVISVTGSGAMTLSGAGSKTLSIRGGTYVPNNLTDGVYITNSTSYQTLTGTDYGDTIKNIYNSGGDTVSIYAGAGNDSIFNDYGYYITINGGAGNDTITSFRGSRNSINGGAGNDVISLSSSNGLTVIEGGTGNDIIYGDSAAHLYRYSNGDGNDIIYGYNSSDSITISGGDWTKSTVGNDVIINIKNTNSNVATGAITLSGAKGKTLNIYPTVPNPISNPTVTQNEVIQKFMLELDTVTSSGIAALDSAVNSASNGHFNTIAEAVSSMVADCQNHTANDFLQNYCGINIENTATEDTGAITGKDAGGSTVKNRYSIIPENGSVHNFTGNTFTTNGATFQLVDINATYNPLNCCQFNTFSYNTANYNNLNSDSKKYMWQALETWWAPQALTLISDSYSYENQNNYSFNASPLLTSKKIYFGFTRCSGDIFGNNFLAWSYRPSGGNDLMIAVNTYYYDNVGSGNPDGTFGNSTQFLDRVLAHELTHSVMKATVSTFSQLPQFITEGTAELVHGIDDNRGNVINYLAANPTELFNSLSMTPGTGNGYSYAGGYMFLRYLAK